MPAVAELQARAVSSAEVALTAAANPIEQWAQIIQDTLANGGALVQSYLNNPLPIVHQLILNGAGYVGQTVTALQSSFSNLVDTLRFDNPFGFPAGVQQGISQILAGQIYEGYNTSFSAGLGLIIGPVFPLLDLLQIPVSMVQNVANVVAKVPQALLGLGLGAIGTINGTLQATAFQVQAVVDALKTGDLLGAVGDRGSDVHAPCDKGGRHQPVRAVVGRVVGCDPRWAPKRPRHLRNQRPQQRRPPRRRLRRLPPSPRRSRNRARRRAPPPRRTVAPTRPAAKAEPGKTGESTTPSGSTGSGSTGSTGSGSTTGSEPRGSAGTDSGGDASGAAA